MFGFTFHSNPSLLNNADKKCWMCVCVVWISQMVTYTKTLAWLRAPYILDGETVIAMIWFVFAFVGFFPTFPEQIYVNETINRLWVKKNTVSLLEKQNIWKWIEKCKKSQRKIARKVDCDIHMLSM